MKVNDLLIKCSNVRLNDNVNLYALIIDSATNEIEKIEDSVYTVLDILNDDGLNNLEVAFFELTNNSLIITTTLYQSFNK